MLPSLKHFDKPLVHHILKKFIAYLTVHDGDSWHDQYPVVIFGMHI